MLLYSRGVDGDDVQSLCDGFLAAVPDIRRLRPVRTAFVFAGLEDSFGAVLTKVSTQIFSDYALNITSYLTLPSLAMAIFTSNFLKKEDIYKCRITL